ncbi:cyclodeaminase/cyclohydrolase family protein [Hyphomicrobium facile]|uniref:Formiminotetrahydrofolate cyclodeaminase n=1 Tax=Hyphomicrobium facile TaxID=51670 RepID=A0A1I7MWK8_9HYPH|nr:cyclodeaminase/cyclohydrolase family protein [Hyphomicrobium facile]SFV26793.1 Formiminotetrahydrofolate cyclodeaminase [Hyphomicrobium facile]
MLVKQSAEELCKVLASSVPAPGGGSVAALSGALAASLVAMVCRLSIGRKEYQPYANTLTDTLEKTEALAASLLRRVDLDAEAFAGVMAAFGMPKDTDDEKQIRAAEIQRAYKEAVQSPLMIARECRDVVFFANKIVGKANANAIGDLGVAGQQALAGLEGAIMNVQINLPPIKDEKYKNEMTNRVTGLLAEGRKYQHTVYKHVIEQLWKARERAGQR